MVAEQRAGEFNSQEFASTAWAFTTFDSTRVAVHSWLCGRAERWQIHLAGFRQHSMEEDAAALAEATKPHKGGDGRHPVRED